MALTYASYLEINELLALQKPRSEGPEHDETLFIIIHQVYELWFKQILHEMDLLQRSLQGGETFAVLHTFKRILTILKTCVVQVDILETMTPLSFNSFRERLETASGFQSVQFREVEIMLGTLNPKRIEHFPADSAERKKLEARLAQPTLLDGFLQYLSLKDYELPASLRKREPGAPPQESEALQKILIDIYHNDPIVAQVCERLVDLDEGLQEWRYRHVKMVERTVGSKIGTGGSSGAEYLKSTLFKPVFPDLWAVRRSL